MFKLSPGMEFISSSFHTTDAKYMDDIIRAFLFLQVFTSKHLIFSLYHTTKYMTQIGYDGVDLSLRVIHDSHLQENA